MRSIVLSCRRNDSGTGISGSWLVGNTNRLNVEHRAVSRRVPKKAIVFAGKTAFRSAPAGVVPDNLILKSISAENSIEENLGVMNHTPVEVQDETSVGQQQWNHCPKIFFQPGKVLLEFTWPAVVVGIIRTRADPFHPRQEWRIKVEQAKRAFRKFARHINARSAEKLPIKAV